MTTRFLIDLRVGPRTLEMAAQPFGLPPRSPSASVALCCGGHPAPLLLIDDHRPYPAAILQVWGLIKHRRRPTRRGGKRHPALKPPPGLQVGVVHKRRDDLGALLGVRTYGLFGSARGIRQRIADLGLGQKINTSHLERLNPDVRRDGQQTRLARRTRNGSRLAGMLQCALWLWRDLYHWTRLHASLPEQTPAMAMGLTDHLWTTVAYLRYSVHVSPYQRKDWAVRRNIALESDLDTRNRKRHYQHHEGLPLLSELKFAARRSVNRSV